jgi:hypothetical protein
MRPGATSLPVMSRRHRGDAAAGEADVHGRVQPAPRIEHGAAAEQQVEVHPGLGR